MSKMICPLPIIGKTKIFQNLYSDLWEKWEKLFMGLYNDKSKDSESNEIDSNCLYSQKRLILKNRFLLS